MNKLPLQKKKKTKKNPHKLEQSDKKHTNFSYL